MFTNKLMVGACFVVVLAACGSGGGAASGGDPKTPAGGDDMTAKGSGTSPPAGSLQEQEYWKALNEEMAAEEKALNEACGTKVKAKFATGSFSGHFTEGGSYGLSGYVRSSCQSLVQSVRDLCVNSEPAKKAVSAKIQQVECKYGTAGKTDVQLNGGTLTGTLDPDAGGAVMSDASTKYLKTKL